MPAPALKILILGLNYAPEHTGIAPYTTGLATGLAARGHDVHVITGYPHYPQWKVADGYGGWGGTEVLDGVTVHRVRHFVPRTCSTPQRLALELTFGARLALAPWGDPDVVLCVSPALLSTAAALLRLLRLRRGRRRPAFAVWVQDLYSLGVVETGGGAAAGGAAARVESAVLRRADGVSVIHDRFRDHLVTGLAVDAGKVAVIKNWTHVEPAPAADRRQARAALGWDSEETIVLHAGNMGAKQGLDNVVEAARLADQRAAPIRFVLLGDGNQREHLQRQAEGVQRITFQAPLPDREFALALAAADVLLVNERPGVEAMAVPSKLTTYFNTGVPVLAAVGATGITASEIRRAKAGLVLPPDQPEAIIDEALRLTANTALARQLGEAGRRFCQLELAQDRAIEHYERWLAALAAGQAAGGDHTHKDAEHTYEQAGTDHRDHGAGRLVPC